MDKIIRLWDDDNKEFAVVNFRDLQAATETITSFCDYFSKSHFKENPSYVQNYIGVNDKNGERIFEGDKILHKGAKGVVYYEFEIAMFMIKFDIPMMSTYSFDSIEGEIEIIGNIHENKN